MRALLALATPPTALFAANNRNMIGALRAATSTRTHTALAGFDDFELADMLSFPLIVVSWPPQFVLTGCRRGCLREISRRRPVCCAVISHARRERPHRALARHAVEDCPGS